MKNRRKQTGFTILETMVVLMVMVAAIAASSVYLKRNADNNLNQAAAANLQKLNQAVKWYAKDNYATLKEAAGTTTLTVDNLIDKKYLESGFSKANSYGQGYRITIQPDSTNSELLQLRITTENGAVISTENMKKIAGIAGSDAGYALAASTITGNQQAWSLSGQSITRGHLASVSYVSGKDIVSAESFLRRDKFDGHPEWNQMNTDLTMTQNSSIIAESDKGTAVLDGQQLVFNDIDGTYSATLTDKTLTFSNGNNQTTIADDGVRTTGDIVTDNGTIEGENIKGKVIEGETVITNSYRTQQTKVKDVPRVIDDSSVFSEATSDYTKIPYILTNYFRSGTSSESPAESLARVYRETAEKYFACDGSLETQGRMVMLGSTNTTTKVILVCANNYLNQVLWID